MSKPIPINDLVNAQVAMISGEPISSVARSLKVPKAKLTSATERVGEIMISTGPALAMERQIISEVLSEHLKPIKEDLAVESLKIIKEADKITVERLTNEPGSIKMKDLIAISDTHSKRLARLTGLEEDPEGGGDRADAERRKGASVFIQNIFQGHQEKLEKERETVNSTDLTPIIDAEPELSTWQIKNFAV